jgi:acetyltransferase-like isoleucine patch superfamily enzyme
VSQPQRFSAKMAWIASRALRGVEVLRGLCAALWYAIVSFGTVKVALSSRIGPGLRIRSVSGGSIRLARISAERNLSFISDGGRIDVAVDCFFNSSCTISSRDSIQIGPNTIFGENVKIYDHDHAYGSGLYDEYVCAPVSVGSRCWFGSNVVILRGVTICDDVVVGANSVVTKSITDPGVYVASGGLRRVRSHPATEAGS